MYFNDTWSFLVQTYDQEIIVVDLKEKEDWEDLTPYREMYGRFRGLLSCSIGKKKKPGDVVKTIGTVWEYNEGKAFNGKLMCWYPMEFPDFVRKVVDAGVFHGLTDEEVMKKKEELKI